MSNKDKIFTEADYVTQQDNAAEWRKTHPDPRHKYVAHYTYNGQPMSEEVWELNAEAAEQHVQNQWSMLGIYFKDLEIKEA